MIEQVSAKVMLGGEAAAFSRGGNRLCFVDPRDSGRCIKVLRPDRSPAIKRGESGFPKNLKPLSSFDDNREEAGVYAAIQRSVGEAAFSMIPRLHGWVETEFGAGLCQDLVRDDDGLIAVTLKQYLWQRGRDAALERVLAEFGAAWSAAGMPSRKLLSHNLVVQCAGGNPLRLWVIDGLGWPDLLPLASYCRGLARRKARRRITALEDTIREQLDKRDTPEDFGYHGWLEEEQRAR
ncbi:YrbL family protein [Haliea sp. E17]|uniref:YrbL family protein n=1 Tax=Haliea sp. E17 TaxID=3401576 RepID=UPI003AAC3029